MFHLCLFCLKLLLILNFTNAVLSKTTFRSIFESYDGVLLLLCAKEIQRLDTIDLKIYSLERNPRLWLDSWQSLETFAKIISVTYIYVLILYWFCNSLGWTKKDPSPSISPPFHPLSMEENWRRQVESLPKHDQINFKLNTLTTVWGEPWTQTMIS